MASQRSQKKHDSLTVAMRGKSGFRSLPFALQHIADGGTITLLPGRYILQGKLPLSVNLIAQGDVSIGIPISNPLEVKTAL